MNKAKYILLILFVFGSLNSFSQTKKELEAQRKELQEEVNKIRSLLSQTRSVEKNELDELAEINLQINAQTKLIIAIAAESKALNKEINGNEREIKKLSNELKELKDDYADMIYKSYKTKSQNSRIMFLLSSQNFHQAFKRVQYMKQYTDFRKAQGTQISKKANELLVLNDTLTVRKKEKEILAAENKKEKEKIQKRKEEQKDVVAKIKKQEKKYISQIKKKQREERQIDKNQSEMFEEEDDLIRRMILGEFAFYYDGNNGKYELYLREDTVVIKAIEVLMDDSIYSSLLTVPEPNQVAVLKK